MNKMYTILNIPLFIFITLLYETDNIPHNIPHIQYILLSFIHLYDFLGCGLLVVGIG